MDDIAEARQWLAEHPGAGSLPSDYPPDERGEVSEGRMSVYSYHSWGGDVETWERLLRGYGIEYVPLADQGARSPEQLFIRDRMDHAMGFLREDQRELLRMRYYEDMTLEDIALELGVRWQSVQDKLATARQDLYVSITRGER